MFFLFILFCILFFINYKNQSIKKSTETFADANTNYNELKIENNKFKIRRGITPNMFLITHNGIPLQYYSTDNLITSVYV
jgi:hypothetical protein